MISNENQSQLAFNQTIVLQMEGGDSNYWPEYLDKGPAQKLFEYLLENIPWHQDELTIYGRRVLAPRLSCWMADRGLSYSYSNHQLRPIAWDARVFEMKESIEHFTRESFNSVLINYYRNGKDSNGWHSDDEKELGPKPAIASLSLGGERDFVLRRKQDHSDKIKLCLANGSLLMMRGDTQRNWQHQVPKRAVAVPRINLTFRQILTGKPAE